MRWLAKIRLAFLEDKYLYLSDKCFLTLRAGHHNEYARYSAQRKRMEEKAAKIKERYSL